MLYTAELVNQIQFYQMPKSMFHNPKYIPMKNDAKLAYMMIRDLLDLSVKNGWVNDRNEVYVKLSRTKLMSRLNIKGTQKFAQVMKELVDYELIIYKRIGLNKCNEIYICIPEDLGIVYSDNELVEMDNLLKFENQTAKTSVETRKCDNHSSKGVNIVPQEVCETNLKTCENQTRTKTNPTNTKDTKNKSINLSVNLILKEQIYIEELRLTYGKIVDEIELNIIEMYSSEFVIIKGGRKPRAVIQSVLSKLTYVHIESVILKFYEVSESTKIKNTKAYLQTMIYNAPFNTEAEIANDIRVKGLIR